MPNEHGLQNGSPPNGPRASFAADLAHSRTEERRAERYLDMFFGATVGGEIFTEAGAEQRAGIDFLVVEPGRRPIPIEHKTRRRGCSKYWTRGPELALETWSVIPGVGARASADGVVGWTLDTTKESEYVLFTFDPADCIRAFWMPFAALLAAFSAHRDGWCVQFHVAREYTYDDAGLLLWASECVFVPVSIVVRAVACHLGWGGLGARPNV